MSHRLPGLLGTALCVGALALLLQGCAGSDAAAPRPEPAVLAEQERVADLRVTLSDALDPADRAVLERVEVPMLLRVSALDWFEHRSYFDLGGDIRLDVEVRAVSLASVLSVWLWRGLVGDDRLAVRVTLRDVGGRRADFELTERTSVAGWAWRHVDDRLDRMARRLGRRIAELLLRAEPEEAQSALARSTVRPTS